MSSINFDNAWLLLVAVPVVLLIVIPYIVTVNKDNFSGHNVASCALHVLMAIIVAFTAAGTTIQTVLTETDVYVVADVSYSANRNLDVVDGYITDLSKNLPHGAQMGVVCFGADQYVLTRTGGTLRSVKEAEVDDSATDIVSALEYTSRIFRSNVIKRIVLITDGRQSDQSDSDAVKQKIAELNAESIYVDAIYLDDNITEDVNEVQVTSVDCGQTVYNGQDAEATALVQSTYSTGAIVSLYEGSTLLESKTVTLNVGVTSVVFSLNTELSEDYDGSDEGELHQYEVQVDADEDYSPYNNTCSFTQSVIDALNVLFISGSNDDYVTINTLYGDSDAVNVDCYINDADVPYTIADLCDYDEIVLADIDLRNVNNYEAFIENLETVVSMLGKSLIGIGDLALQDTTDEYLLRLADMLPVSYGKSDDETTLYTLVLDASNSMAGSTNYGASKFLSAAEQILDIMEEQDEICLVVFYGSVYVQLLPTTIDGATFELDGVTYTGREAIDEALNTIDLKHGTLVGYALDAASELITSLDYDNKRVVLVSDGMTATDSDIDSDEVIKIVKGMYNVGITTTVLDVGRGNQTDGDASVAADFLSKIALAGSGNKTDVVDVSGTESTVSATIFAQIASILGETIVDTSSTVSVARYYDEVLDTLKEKGYILNYTVTGTISGYVIGKAKTDSTTVLTAEYESDDGGVSTVPIYAYRGYGNGKAVSFTSSISESWLGKWASNGAGDILIDSMVSVSTPEERVSVPLTMEITEETGYYSLEITPVSLRTDGVVTVTLTDEDGDETALSGVVFGSSSYSGTFALTEVGRYAVDVTYSYGTESYTVRKYINVSYLNEYDAFAVCDASVLYQAISSSGTVSEDGSLTIENDEDEVGLRIIDLTIPLLVSCVVLFAVDVIVRKLKWEDIRSLFVKVNKNKEKKQ